MVYSRATLLVNRTEQMTATETTKAVPRAYCLVQHLGLHSEWVPVTELA